MTRLFSIARRGGYLAVLTGMLFVATGCDGVQHYQLPVSYFNGALVATYTYNSMSGVSATVDIKIYEPGTYKFSFSKSGGGTLPHDFTKVATRPAEIIVSNGDLPFYLGLDVVRNGREEFHDF